MAAVFGQDVKHYLTTAVLLQMSSSRIDPYTNHVATRMMADLQLSTKGARNLSACLSNLPYKSTPDDRLTFGYGPDNVIREPGVHGDGYDHLAVMMALGSTFHESYAAEVLHAYASIIGNEYDVLPHLRNWRNQVRTFCGMLMASGFPQLVEDYIRLDPYSIGPGSNLQARRCRVAPSDMAKSLVALSKVVSKQEKQVTLVGGATLGWFAALSEWLYDLRVAIVSTAGEKLHGDIHDEATQVILVYHQEPDVAVLTEHWSTVTEKAKEDDSYWTKYTHFLPFGGRVAWHSLLPQVFGHAYWSLDHQEASTLAVIIGCAARALFADYNSHVAQGREDFYKYAPNESAYGLGLIENVTAWLPELRKGQGKMERQLKRDPLDAEAQYEEHIAKLQRLCGCDICSPVNASAPPPAKGYCLPTICETIIALGLAISRMTVESGVYPTRQGVQGLYSSQAAKRREVKALLHHRAPGGGGDNGDNGDDKNLNLADKARHYEIIYANEWMAPPARRLQNAVALFAGTRPELDLPPGLVALAHEGVCAYLVQLRRPDGRGRGPPRDDEDRGLIQITAGAVNVRQKIYTRVSALPPEVVDSYDFMAWEQVRFDHLADVMYCK